MVRIYVRAYRSETLGVRGVYSIFSDNADDRIMLHRHTYPFAKLSDAVFLSINASLRSALALGADEVVVYADSRYAIQRIQDPWRATAQDQNYLTEMNGLVNCFDCVHFVHTTKNQKYPRVDKTNHITKYRSK